MPEDEERALGGGNTPRDVATFKIGVIPKLRELGFTRLTINYSGSGDEGAIDGIDIEPEGLALPPELEEQIKDLADRFLYAEYGSWEDNDGATGTIIIDPAQGKILNEHGRYSTEVNYETKEF